MSIAAQNVTSFVSSTLESIEPAFAVTLDVVVPKLQFVADRIQDVWNFLAPYLVSTAQFMMSKAGISFELLAVSLIPLHLSKTTDNKVVSAALLAAGVLIAGAGGFFLCSSGVLPSFLTNVTPIASV